MRSLRLLLVLLLLSCKFRVPVEPLAFDLAALRLGETDFTELVRAIDRVQLGGTAQLRPGRYALETESYAAMEVTEPTVVDFQADVSLASETEGDQLQVTPAVRTFSVRFDHPIVLHGRTDSRRVTLNGASLSEEDDGSYDVDVKVGRSLMGTIASAVVGVPAGLENAPSALEMLGRVEVGELTTTLRPGARLRHGGSELVVQEGSNLVLRRIDVNVENGSARLDVDGSLRLGEGTCLATDDGRLCVDAMTLEVHGDYQRSEGPAGATQRLRLTQLDRPSRLDVGSGRLEWTDGAEAVAVESGSIELERYECAGPNAERCAYVADVALQTGEGALVLEGHPLRFQGLTITGAKLTRTEDEGSVLVERIVVTSPKLRVQGAGAEVGFGTLTLEGLQGARWGQLAMASGAVRTSGGAVQLDLGGTRIGAQLVGETRLTLSQREEILLTTATSSESEQNGEQNEEEQSALPTLGLRAEVDDVRLALDGVPFAAATGLAIDATLGTTSTAELRIREAVQIDAGALGSIEMGSIRLDFRALRVEHGTEGTRLHTQGLRLSLPQENVLSMLRLHVPPSFVGDETPLEGSLEATLATAASALDLGQLSHFRTRIEAAGLDQLDMRFERGRLRLRGDVDATLRVLADERRVHLRECTHTVDGTLPVPCFDDDGLPSICERPVSVEVPYPCVENEDVDAEILNQTLRLRLDVAGEVTSNAPANLGELALTARVARCNRVDVQGLDDRMERLLDVEGTICERLREVSETMRLGEVLDVASSPVLAGARVERLDIDSDARDLHIGLDLDVRLDARLDAPAADPVVETRQ